MSLPGPDVLPSLQGLFHSFQQAIEEGNTLAVLAAWDNLAEADAEAATPYMMLMMAGLSDSARQKMLEGFEDDPEVVQNLQAILDASDSAISFLLQDDDENDVQPIT